MRINNEEFNKFCLSNFGFTFSKEDMEKLKKNSIEQIEKSNVLNLKDREIAIEVLENIIDSILKSEKVDVKDEYKEITLNVISKILKLSVKNSKEEEMIDIIIKMLKNMNLLYRN